MQRFPRVLLLLCFAAFGWATAITGTTDVVRITSMPPGATATIDGQSYQTPVTLTLSRTKSYDITFQKSGYLPAHRSISRVGNAVTEANLIAGGVVGILTDQASGAAFRLYPTDVTVELAPTDPVSEKVYLHDR